MKALKGALFRLALLTHSQTRVRGFLSSETLQTRVDLIVDKYDWKDSKILLHTIVKACKLSNDIVKHRFLIHLNLLEMLLFEIDRYYKNSQPYLFCMYKALFCMAYYGLMHIGELALGDHSVKASNVHLASNKNKLLIILYTSKTLDKSNNPKKITISECEKVGRKRRFFCPFKAIRDFIMIQGCYVSDNENFVLENRLPVKPIMVRNLLRKLILHLNLNPKLYDCQSFRIGHAVDLEKFGVSVEEIKRLGCWKSNAVYRYLKR